MLGVIVNVKAIMVMATEKYNAQWLKYYYLKSTNAHKPIQL